MTTITAPLNNNGTSNSHNNNHKNDDKASAELRDALKQLEVSPME